MSILFPFLLTLLFISAPLTQCDSYNLASDQPVSIRSIYKYGYNTIHFANRLTTRVDLYVDQFKLDNCTLVDDNTGIRCRITSDGVAIGYYPCNKVSRINDLKNYYVVYVDDSGNRSDLGIKLYVVAQPSFYVKQVYFPSVSGSKLPNRFNFTLRTRLISYVNTVATYTNISLPIELNGQTVTDAFCTIKPISVDDFCVENFNITCRATISNPVAYGAYKMKEEEWVALYDTMFVNFAPNIKGNLIYYPNVTYNGDFIDSDDPEECSSRNWTMDTFFDDFSNKCCPYYSDISICPRSQEEGQDQGGSQSGSEEDEEEEDTCDTCIATFNCYRVNFPMSTSSTKLSSMYTFQIYCDYGNGPSNFSGIEATIQLKDSNNPDFKIKAICNLPVVLAEAYGENEEIECFIPIDYPKKSYMIDEDYVISNNEIYFDFPNRLNVLITYQEVPSNGNYTDYFNETDDDFNYNENDDPENYSNNTDTDNNNQTDNYSNNTDTDINNDTENYENTNTTENSNSTEQENNQETGDQEEYEILDDLEESSSKWLSIYGLIYLIYIFLL